MSRFFIPSPEATKNLKSEVLNNTANATQGATSINTKPTYTNRPWRDLWQKIQDFDKSEIDKQEFLEPINVKFRNDF